MHTPRRRCSGALSPRKDALRRRFLQECRRPPAHGRRRTRCNRGAPRWAPSSGRYCCLTIGAPQRLPSRWSTPSPATVRSHRRRVLRNGGRAPPRPRGIRAWLDAAASVRRRARRFDGRDRQLRRWHRRIGVEALALTDDSLVACPTCSYTGVEPLLQVDAATEHGNADARQGHRAHAGTSRADALSRRRLRSCQRHQGSHVAALDLASSRLLPWSPVIALDRDVYDEVQAILATGSVVYVGGGLRSVDGRAHANVAAIDAGSGGVLPWDPRADGSIFALGITRGRRHGRRPWRFGVFPRTSWLRSTGRRVICSRSLLGSWGAMGLEG